MPRLGMTAIAAVLALPSTPALAQEATAQTPTATTEAAPATDPLAPAAESATTETAPAATTEAAPAPAKVKKLVSTTAKKAVPVRAKATPKPAAAQPTPADSVETAIAAPAPAPMPLAAEPSPFAEPEPTAQPVKAQDAADDILPIAGAAGAGILALAGLGMAMRRRRRDEEGEPWTDEAPLLELERPIEPAAPIAEEVVAAPVAAPVRTADSAECENVPDGFDMSRFGRHVQAAYCGPSENNPSLSLKRRLKVARALDQRERLSGASHPKPESMAKPTVPDKPLMNQFRPVTVSYAKAGAKPAFQY
jgi:hypothetical protein